MQRDLLAGPVRERLKQLPPPYEQHYGVVPAPPPEDAIMLGSSARSHEEALPSLGRVSALAAGALNPYWVSRVLTRREAVSSSAIEGTYSTLNDLLELESGEDGEKTAAVRQVRDYSLILDEWIPSALEAGPRIFSVEMIQSLHREVMKSDPGYGDAPGDLRERVAWIGGSHIAESIWNPPPPADVRGCLNDTIEYLRNEGMQSMTQGLLTRMAIAHAHFEAVHPFRDGNGRVGRLLLPLMMAAEKQVPLYLSPYIEAHKQAYVEALKAAQQRLEWHSLAGFFADAMTGTIYELQLIREALDKLMAGWMERRKFRKNSAPLKALNLLRDYPVITVGLLRDQLLVSAQQANEAVRLLLDAGVLHEKTGRRRDRVFVAREVLAIVNRPYGAAAAAA